MAKTSPATEVTIPRMGGGGGRGGAKRFQPTEKPKNTAHTLFRLLSIYAKQWKYILAAIFLTLVSVLLSLSVPLLIGYAVNTFDISSNLVNAPLLGQILLVLLAAYLANWFVTTLNGWMMAGVSQNLVKSMRQTLYKKLQHLPLKFYDTHPHGDTMSRITNDIDNISSTIAQTTTELFSSILNITGSLVMMLVLSIPLTLVALISIPLVLLLTRSIASRSRYNFIQQFRAMGELGGLIEESIQELKMVKAFHKEDDMLSQFAQSNNELLYYCTKAQIWSGLLMPLMNVINNISFGCIACVGGLLSVRGLLSVGTIASFITYSKQFGQPLNNIAGMFNSIQSALAGAERVFEIMDETEEPHDITDPISLDHPKGEVSFEHVSFSYTEDKPILTDVHFHVSPGQTIALVGETGAGKTTIVNLLTRFYDITNGTIRIDGIDIRTFKRESLRRCFSVVLQDTCLFTGTIADNIRYGNPSASDEEVQNAAKLAHAHSFISRLPQGYQTYVSGSTDNLSQGQRQLLAIARAFLTNAPILILDEATSSVDTRTEKNIQKAMLHLMEGRTSFLIAHRLSTIRDADRIMVIGNHGILESGTHTELMQQKNYYYKMVVSQMGLDDSIATASTEISL